MESDFSPLESAISYKFLMFQKIPKRRALFLNPSFFIKQVSNPFFVHLKYGYVSGKQFDQRLHLDL